MDLGKIWMGRVVEDELLDEHGGHHSDSVGVSIRYGSFLWLSIYMLDWTFMYSTFWPLNVNINTSKNTTKTSSVEDDRLKSAVG